MYPFLHATDVSKAPPVEALLCGPDRSVAGCRRREGAAGMENGTAHYLGIAAVRHGFAQIHRLGGFSAVAAHTQAVTRWADLIRFLAVI